MEAAGGYMYTSAHTLMHAGGYMYMSAHTPMHAGVEGRSWQGASSSLTVHLLSKAGSLLPSLGLRALAF